MSECKGKIAVLTSGGDAPGMNAAIRAVVRTGIAKGYEVYGVRRGYNGILNKEIDLLTFHDVSEKLQHGGTFLFTARSAEFREEAGKKKAAEICKEMGIETLVVIGGDGSFTGAKNLSKYGVNVIGLPGTIDLDIAYTEYTIGFDTAVNTAMEAIDKLRETSNSHERCSVVEVMGRSAGYTLVNFALLVQGGEDLLHGGHVVVVGGADEAIIGDVQQLPQALEVFHDVVYIFFRSDTGLGGVDLDLLTVLVGAGEEHHIIPLHSLVAGDGIAGHGAIAVTDVRVAAGIVDGGGDVKCFPFHSFYLRLYFRYGHLKMAFCYYILFCRNLQVFPVFCRCFAQNKMPAKARFGRQIRRFCYTGW